MVYFFPQVMSFFLFSSQEIYWSRAGNQTQKTDRSASICEMSTRRGAKARLFTRALRRGRMSTNGQSAKSELNKSLQDATFGQFVQILEYLT